MTPVEWRYDLDARVVAPADLLDQTFGTRIAGHDTTVWPPLVPIAEGDRPWNLAPPRILGRPPAESDSSWGSITRWEDGVATSVIVERLAFTTEIPAAADEDQAAESLVDAMDGWWDNVLAWLELVTGQHLTRVAHEKTRYIGSPTPIWPLNADGSHGRPFSFMTTVGLHMGRTVPAVTAEIFQGCVALADESPSLAWILLRDARSLAKADHPRRAIIDAATAAEIAVTAMLEDSLSSETQTEATKLRNQAKMFKQKAVLLGKRRGRPFPHTFFRDLVYKRNDAVHQAVPISPGDFRAALAEAVAVVEAAFPLPVPPGASQPLSRIW
jgi:hypothetical protein